MRRIATALSLGALASMWSVCSTMGMQSWNMKGDDLEHSAYSHNPHLLHLHIQEILL